ncbi:MAG: cobalt ECF transporter T component CbiQ [Oscillospiraceae bacterium]|nr:cobalt ECF transporter T component CbiQ [Oscillospiraceae bacterium]
MSAHNARVHELRALDTLSAGQTAIHRLHPLAKLICTMTIVICTVSFGPYDFIRLVPYLFYPFIMMSIAELPYRLLLSRVLIALPFCLFAGISNVIFNRSIALTIGSMNISFGVLSLFTILLKMYLCVMAALLLVATTPFTELTTQLRWMRIPYIFVMVFEMTYRYIAVLLEEAYSMTTAYRLRSGSKKAIEMRHMGSFVGQMLLRGFDRAERVYTAMACRGYSLKHIPFAKRKMTGVDFAFLSAVFISCVLIRVINLR